MKILLLIKRNDIFITFYKNIMLLKSSIDINLFSLSWNVNSDTGCSELCWLAPISIYNTVVKIRTPGDNAKKKCNAIHGFSVDYFWCKNLYNKYYCVIRASLCSVWCTLLRKLYTILLGLSKQSGCVPSSPSRQMFCSTRKRILSLNPRGIVACKLKYLQKKQ